MTRQRRARTEEQLPEGSPEGSPVTPSTPPYVNPSTREFPKRPSPLANEWVVSGYRYDMSTGLVSPIPQPPEGSPEGSPTPEGSPEEEVVTK